MILGSGGWTIRILGVVVCIGYWMYLFTVQFIMKDVIILAVKRMASM